MTEIEARLAALEAEVRIVRDHIAVTQLVASYGPLADAAIDAEGRTRAVALFTEDGVYDLGCDWHLQGRAAIASVFDNPEHLTVEAQGAAHIMGLPHVRIDGDHATALNYTQLHRRDGESYTTIRIAANFWELDRTPDGWKIRHRRNHLLTGSDEGFALLRKIDR